MVFKLLGPGLGCSKIHCSFVDFVKLYPLLYAGEYMYLNYQIFDLQRKVWKTQEITVSSYVHVHILNSHKKQCLT